MAIMYPKQLNENANAAEKKVYKILNQGLGSLNICYHNYNVTEKETDFIVVIPGEGIVIIEVKGWNGVNIEEVVDNDTIKYKNAVGKIDIYNSPLKQANGYRYKLVSRIKNELGINIKVSSLVCYPFMWGETFNNKGLKVISPREITILKDDLEDIHQFGYMLKKKYSQYIAHNLDPFNQANYLKIRSLFETEQNIGLSSELSKRKLKRVFAEKRYSILAYIKEIEEQATFKKRIEQYFYSWLVGTKIVFILESEQQKQYIYELFEDKLQEEVGYLNNYKQFLFYDVDKERYKDRVFNFEIYMGKLEAEAFEIIDGKDKEELREQLKEADEKTNFNYRQYVIEHHNDNENMIVKAGAGTGKTYSMVSRISYLYYSNRYTPEDLVDAIIMITFTNEAAQNMKVRLKEHFTNMAILTEDVEYLRVMENISRMKISTIHSLCKKVIQRYSKYLGMGKSVRMKSGVYERRLEIQAVLDQEIGSNEVYKNLLSKVGKHELISTVEYLLDELEKKNIDLKKNYCFDFPKEEQELFALLQIVTIKVQRNMIIKNIDYNTVHLNDLMIYIGKLIDELEKHRPLKEKVDYLFVDEFQDTDDVQIHLVKRFYNIFEFKLFVVGDIKQSIYRFRGAEDKAFTRLKQEIDKWVTNDFTLNKNYRSDVILLKKFDDLFTYWRKHRALDYDVDNMEAGDRLIGVNKDETIQNHVECIPYEKENFEKVLLEVIKRKQKELDIKYKGRGKKGKIAILVRKNEEIEAVRKACEGEISIATDTTENLYQMTPTKDLYYLILAMQFNTSPKHLYALSQTNYCRGISNRVVYQSKIKPDCIPKAFETGEMIPRWIEYMENVKKKPVLRVIRDIIQDVKPWNNYANQFTKDQKQKREHYKVNLDLIIEDIVQHSEEEYVTINKLEQYLYIKIFANQHQDERRIEEESSEHEVRCLTVHKSKGLEYDHVILPFVHSDITSMGVNKMIIKDNEIFVRIKINDEITLVSKYFNKQIKQEKQDTLCEEARILYVALTRAEDTVTWLKQIDFKEGASKKYWRNLLDKEV